MENYLDKSDDIKLETDQLELLMDPKDSEVNLRYILAHDARRRGSRIFEIFSTKACRNGWLECRATREAQRDLKDMTYEGTIANAPPCPERRVRTPLPQQSSSSTREEESQWSAQEGRLLQGWSST